MSLQALEAELREAFVGAPADDLMPVLAQTIALEHGYRLIRPRVEAVPIDRGRESVGLVSDGVERVDQ